jgi:hypothetical protein
MSQRHGGKRVEKRQRSFRLAFLWGKPAAISWGPSPFHLSTLSFRELRQSYGETHMISNGGPCQDPIPANNLHECTVLEADLLAPVKPPDDCDDSGWHLNCNILKSWAIQLSHFWIHNLSNCETINVYCFKLLSFEVICCGAIERNNTHSSVFNASFFLTFHILCIRKFVHSALEYIQNPIISYHFYHLHGHCPSSLTEFWQHPPYWCPCFYSCTSSVYS